MLLEVACQNMLAKSGGHKIKTNLPMKNSSVNTTHLRPSVNFIVVLNFFISEHKVQNILIRTQNIYKMGAFTPTSNIKKKKLKSIKRKKNSTQNVFFE